MHIDTRTLPDNTVIEGDICIVGTGPAGLSIAMEWNNTPYRVILLEGGGFDYDDQVQDLYAGRTTGQPYFPLKSSHLHYFGGTSNHWGGFCSTFDELDFEQRSWVPHSGWPIKKADLDPFYARAHPILDLGPCEYDETYWQKKDPALKSLLPDNPAVRNKVWQFSTPTRFGPKYGPAVKQSKNIHLYTYANVTDIEANDNVSVIESLTLRNFAGKRHTVKAKRFVLACGAIQNARILLACNRQAPKGLGNDNDLVGRFFMDHLELKSAYLHLPTADSLKLYMLEWGKTKMRCELAISREIQARHAILNGTASLKSINEANIDTPAMKSWTSDDPRKNGHVGFVRDHLARSISLADRTFGVSKYMLYTRIEQAPNPDSRITLDGVSDPLGMPRAILHWELTPLERRSIRTIYELIGRQFGAAGRGRTQLMDYLEDPDDASWPDFASGGWHHIGTTRMSDDPHTGVVDANCKVHGIGNLYIAGSSCFVTAGAPNPTLTIVALSLRLSDHLKKLT
ncbi:MAG TPA: GMC family oxidoreductase [Puia sp.]|nr:GMC family oxidoreductase [Puia sp.]